MTYLDSILLSIVEGITEFLPISSTGHLVLAARLLGIPQTEFVKSFEVIIQLGAILAVVVLYWRTFLHSRAVWKKIALAFIPTGVVGFTLYPLIKGVLLGNEVVTLLALLVGGIALIVVEWLHKEKKDHHEEIEQMSNKQAVLVGLFQSLSIIPGTSRAASTIVGGMLLGVKRKTAVEFSFLLAVPTMLAATGLDLIKSNFSFSSYEYSLLAVGFVGSFLFALLAIKLLLKFVKNHTLVPFGIYRILLAVLYWTIVLR